VALVHHAGAGEPAVAALGRALLAAGHAPLLVAAAGAPTAGLPSRRVPRLPAALLRVRGLDEELAHVPAAALALRRGRFDALHAFSPEDALAASLAVAERVAITFAAPLRRERLADRRLRLPVLVRAVERSGAVLAVSEEVRASLAWWLGVDARVLAPGDAEAHAALYSQLARPRVPHSPTP
jgi:hypothetical protein